MLLRVRPAERTYLGPGKKERQCGAPFPVELKCAAYLCGLSCSSYPYLPTLGPRVLPATFPPSGDLAGGGRRGHPKLPGPPRGHIVIREMGAATHLLHLPFRFIVATRLLSFIFQCPFPPLSPLSILSSLTQAPDSLCNGATDSCKTCFLCFPLDFFVPLYPTEVTHVDWTFPLLHSIVPTLCHINHLRLRPPDPFLTSETIARDLPKPKNRAPIFHPPTHTARIVHTPAYASLPTHACQASATIPFRGPEKKRGAASPELQGNGTRAHHGMMAPPYSNGYAYKGKGPSALLFQHSGGSFRDRARPVLNAAARLSQRLWHFWQTRGRRMTINMLYQAGWQLRQNLTARRLLSFPHLLVCLWMLILLWGERWVFSSRVADCRWSNWESWVS